MAFSNQMSGFTKLWSSIVTSTIWRESSHIKVVWITMLALADRNGNVQASVPGLADMARVSMPECLEALQKLMAPDEWSRSKNDEGRRLREIEGGWVVINYPKYRALGREDSRREQIRDAVRRHRAKQDEGAPIVVSDVSKTENVISPVITFGLPSASASAEAKASSSASSSDAIPFDAVPELLSRIPTSSRPAWAAEIEAARVGMHGPILTPAQIDTAARDYVGNGHTEKRSLRHFRAYLASAALPAKPAKPAPSHASSGARMSKQEIGVKNLQDAIMRRAAEAAQHGE